MRDVTGSYPVDFWTFGASQNCYDRAIPDIGAALWQAGGVWVRRSGRVDYTMHATATLVAFAADLVCEMLLELPKPDASAVFLMENADLGDSRFGEHMKSISNEAPKGSPERAVYTSVRLLCTPPPRTTIQTRLQQVYALIDASGMRPSWRTMLTRRLDYAAAHAGHVSFDRLSEVYGEEKAAA